MEQSPLRMTYQREIILEELKKTKTHPTADELYATVKQRIPHISLATVYRNLETLANSGLVRKLEVTGRQKRFDGNTEPHDHITCTVCQRIDDIVHPLSEGQAPMPQSAAWHGYRLTGWSVEYFGICPDCLQKSSAAVTDNTR